MKTNIEIVQEGYMEFGKSNIPALLDLLDENVVWELPATADVSFSGVFTGKNEVMRFFQNVGASNDFHDFKVEKLLADDSTVIALGSLTATAKPTGKTSSNKWAHRWEIQNGKVTQHYEYVDSAEIRNAFH